MADELIKVTAQARRVRVGVNTVKRRGRVRLGQARKRFRERGVAGLLEGGEADSETAVDPADGSSTDTFFDEIVHLPPTATPEEIAAELGRAGALVVDNLVEPEVMDRLLAEMDPYIEATAPGHDDYAGRNTRRTGGLIARSETARELVQHPTVLGTVGTVLNESPTYQINLTQVITVGPGEPPQKIHRDHWTFGDFPFPHGHEVQCSTIWALDDFTEENGATRVIPGSNHAGNRLSFKHRDTIPAEMTKGSVFFYTGSVYHGGGMNQTSTPRRGLNLTYIVGWLRQEENQYLSVPRDVARTLPTALLRLMGYQECGVSLGYVDDCRDPLTALEVDTG